MKMRPQNIKNASKMTFQSRRKVVCFGIRGFVEMYVFLKEIQSFSLGQAVQNYRKMMTKAM